jgi:hypothetical protein
VSAAEGGGGRLPERKQGKGLGHRIGCEKMFIAPIGDLWPLALMLGGLLLARFVVEQRKHSFPPGVYVLKGKDVETPFAPPRSDASRD